MSSDPLPSRDFRAEAHRHAAWVAATVVTPFALANFVQHRPVVGGLSVAILLLFVVNALKRWGGPHNPWISFLFLVPVALAFLGVAVYELQFIGVLWCYPALLAFYFMLEEKQAWLASALEIVTVVPTAFLVMEPAIVLRLLATLAVTSAFAAIFLRLVARQQAHLRTLATTDPLTGLHNRLLLPTTLEQAVIFFRRSRTPMTLVIIDVDRFKAINDRFGHAVGDEVLQGLAAILQMRMRRSDRLFRWGGEEFLALLYGTALSDGVAVAEALRHAIAEARLLPGQQVTASFGVAALVSGESWSDWVQRADANLFKAKSAGRNRVVDSELLSLA